MHRGFQAYGQQVTRAAAVAAIAGVVAGLALLILAAVGPARPPAGAIADAGWTARSRAWFTTRGLYPAEVDSEGRHHAWTGTSVRLVVPNLDRTADHTLTLTMTAARPSGTALPRVSWIVDGEPSPDIVVPNADTPVAIALPRREIDRAVIVLQVSDTWDPGPNDDRRLGVRISGIALDSSQRRLGPTTSVVAWLALATMLVVWPVWLASLPRALSVVTTIGVVAALVWLTWVDAAFLGDFPDALVRVAAASSLIAAVVAVAALSIRRPLGDWSGAAALVLATATVKLALFTHPGAIVGDGIFQVHRAQLVAAGQYFFTSVTPRPFFEFPYAVALYVAAMPFWSWVPRELDRLWLLRVVTLVADAAVGLSLYVVGRRVWADPRAALYVAGLWPFARAPFEALSNANLTNAFGQNVFGVAMAALALAIGGAHVSWAAAAAAAAVLALAVLSHFSTLTIGVLLLLVVAAAVAVASRSGDRVKAGVVLLVLFVAASLAYVTYYRHFGQVYRQTIERVRSEAPAEPTGSAMTATPTVKLRRWLTGGSDDYGLPGLPLAVAAVFGAVALARDRRRETWTVMLAAWLAVWAGATTAGIVSSVQMRVNLASAPLFVCLGAYGLARAETAGRQWVAWLGAALVVWDGFRLWRICLGV